MFYLERKYLKCLILQIQQDLDELQDNMEENEKAQAEVKEEVKLGRIQYKLDYDFQQGQVLEKQREIWTLILFKI